MRLRSYYISGPRGLAVLKLRQPWEKKSRSLKPFWGLDDIAAMEIRSIIPYLNERRGTIDSRNSVLAGLELSDVKHSATIRAIAIETHGLLA